MMLTVFALVKIPQAMVTAREVDATWKVVEQHEERGNQSRQDFLSKRGLRGGKVGGGGG